MGYRLRQLIRKRFRLTDKASEAKDSPRSRVESVGRAKYIRRMRLPLQFFRSSREMKPSDTDLY
jgi:hypothetical protein